MQRSAAEPKVLICDVDGTLLDSAGRLSERTADAITTLSDAGIAVVLASGRILTGLRALCARLELTGPQIAMHGALVATPAGEIVSSLPLSSEDVLAHLAFAESVGVPMVLCYPDRLVANTLEPEVRAAFLPYDEPLPELQPDLASLAGTGPMKTTLCLDGIRYHEILAAAEAGFANRYTATSANERELELVRREATKGTAARRVAVSLGVSPEEIGAIGDGPNDVELFRVAGISAALANAGTVARSAATFVAPSNDHDGVAEAIARMFPSRFGS